MMDNISDGGMQKTLSTRGGRTVYQQLVHVHNVRMGWLEVCAIDIFKKYRKLDKEKAFDRRTLRKSFEDSSRGLEELFEKSWDNAGKVRSFKSGLIPMMSYFISHESHHRGNILLTLKQCGEKIPDSLKWGLWEWGK